MSWIIQPWLHCENIKNTVHLADQINHATKRFSYLSETTKVRGEKP